MEREAPLDPEPKHKLYGHDDAVISVALHPGLDVVVSGSRDGSIIIYSLQHGRYIRSIYREVDRAVSSSSSSSTSNTARAYHSPHINWVGVSGAGYVVTYGENTLVSYTINGRKKAQKVLQGPPINSLMFSEDGNVLLIGGKDIEMLWVYSLELADDGPREGLRNLSKTDGSSQSSVSHVVRTCGRCKTPVGGFVIQACALIPIKINKLIKIYIFLFAFIMQPG